MKPVASSLSLVRVWKALTYSLKGIWATWRDEPAFRQEVYVAIVFIPMTLWLPISRLETVILLAMFGLVFALELLNSAIEAIVDFASPEFHSLAGKAKDCGSAAVFVAAMSLVGAWLAICGPVILRQT